MPRIGIPMTTAEYMAHTEEVHRNIQRSIAERTMTKKEYKNLYRGIRELKRMYKSYA